MFGSHGNVASDILIVFCSYKIPVLDSFGQGNAHGILGQTGAHTATMSTTERQEFIHTVVTLQEAFGTKDIRFGVKFRIVVDADNGNTQCTPGRDVMSHNFHWLHGNTRAFSQDGMQTDGFFAYSIKIRESQQQLWVGVWL